ncbi:conserved hypothetical protein [Vibrio phage 137E35-1]|nr:conserved hypothetical protein [Vibrio phage 137E35-1]CAH9016213.1 conserved hypothetical protein [Vibrio phage 230E39-1]
MFQNTHSHYALKKALKHELDKIGIARKGWTMEDERSHHLTHGSFEAMNIFDKAIERQAELRNSNGDSNHG